MYTFTMVLNGTLVINALFYQNPMENHTLNITPCLTAPVKLKNSTREYPGKQNFHRGSPRSAGKGYIIEVHPGRLELEVAIGVWTWLSKFHWGSPLSTTGVALQHPGEPLGGKVFSKFHLSGDDYSNSYWGVPWSTGCTRPFKWIHPIPLIKY